MIRDPLKRAILLRDVWAAYDHLATQNIRRVGSRETRRDRHELGGKLARILATLALTDQQLPQLPDTYAAAVASGDFARRQNFDSSNDYLPRGLFTMPGDWVEIDFYQPDLHEDLYERDLCTAFTRDSARDDQRQGIVELRRPILDLELERKLVKRSQHLRDVAWQPTVANRVFRYEPNEPRMRNTRRQTDRLPRRR